MYILTYTNPFQEKERESCLVLYIIYIIHFLNKETYYFKLGIINISIISSSLMQNFTQDRFLR